MIIISFKIFTTENPCEQNERKKTKNHTHLKKILFNLLQIRQKNMKKIIGDIWKDLFWTLDWHPILKKLLNKMDNCASINNPKYQKNILIKFSIKWKGISIKLHNHIQNDLFCKNTTLIRDIQNLAIQDLALIEKNETKEGQDQIEQILKLINNNEQKEDKQKIDLLIDTRFPTIASLQDNLKKAEKDNDRKLKQLKQHEPPIQKKLKQNNQNEQNLIDNDPETLYLNNNLKQHKN